MKNLFATFIALFLSIGLSAQILKPVKWEYSVENISGKEATIVIKANIDKGWYLYSQYVEDGGPIPTTVKFNPNASYQLVGKTEEVPAAKVIFDPIFEMSIGKFINQAFFKQKIKLNANQATITGTVEFMVCDDSRCLAPQEIEFSVEVNATDNPVKDGDKTDANSDTLDTADNVAPAEMDTAIDPIETIPVSGGETAGLGLWAIFIAGLLGGFAAFIMPCIFPMVPLTVSYFTKRSGSKQKGVFNAIIYGLSIIVIYVILGLGVTLLFGSGKLNELASNATFNLLFFALLIVFAISFFGAFEITLPSSWVNKADQQSDKGGLLGMFFMAFTLALVSFSCTGPIIGTLLVQAASQGEILGPMMGMLGFSIALALPFTLFAIFPDWLNNLPKSGGWLNSVKVTLGFLELALALKFLSNVDLAYHWGILDREVFLVLWIIIFVLLGFYLLGKLKFAHDSDLKFISVPRLFFAIISLSFAMYMVPGLWGAPLKAISAFAPPLGTQDFDLYTRTLGVVNSGTSTSNKVKKYSEGMPRPPHNLNVYYDYEEGIAYAKTVNKPVLVDFTGHTCVNCRKMEAQVWSDPEVLRLLNEEYVILSLYVDDKKALPEEEQYVSDFDGRKINTVGKKWTDLQASVYNTNSQPYYVIINHEGKTLIPPTAYDLNPRNYVNFLNRGKLAFESDSK